MLTKTIASSETIQVFVRCHVVRPDEAWTDGYVMPCVFQWARDTTMAPVPDRADGLAGYRRFACSPPTRGGSPRRSRRAA
jgi:hypothetical protein